MITLGNSQKTFWVGPLFFYYFWVADYRYNDRFSLSHQICEKLIYIYFNHKLTRILLNASKKKSDEIDKN